MEYLQQYKHHIIHNGPKFNFPEKKNVSSDEVVNSVKNIVKSLATSTESLINSKQALETTTEVITSESMATQNFGLLDNTLNTLQNGSVDAIGDAISANVTSLVQNNTNLIENVDVETTTPVSIFDWSYRNDVLNYNLSTIHRDVHTKWDNSLYVALIVFITILIALILTLLLCCFYYKRKNFYLYKRGEQTENVSRVYRQISQAELENQSTSQQFTNLEYDKNAFKF